MTDEQLNRWQGLADATPAMPWTAETYSNRWGVFGPDNTDLLLEPTLQLATFLAAAREAIPQLIAEVRRLQCEKSA